MRLRLITRVLQTVAVCTLTVLPAAAQTPADNTKVNTRDRAKGAQTADQQKNDVGDRDLTQKIRQAVMDDKSLSSYAHNVKIITQAGHVTLKGPVRSLDEKRAIAAKATEIAGADHVTNQMSVARQTTKKQ